MTAFAANSLLCRAALRDTAIDPASFTMLRIVSGALTLWLLTRPASRVRSGSGNWPSALALFVYAAAFSFAYVTLSAATGALLLIGAVQVTMIGHALSAGERLRGWRLIGLVLAFAGLVGLLLPGLSAPPLAGSLLMLGAGCAWGIYSLRGKSGGDPSLVTAGNFIRAAPMTVLLSVIGLGGISFDAAGVWYALLSGSLASGAGYVVWYVVLPALRSTDAAVVQLSVPVIAAAGGVVLLGEALTPRLLVASAAILGGIALVMLANRRANGVTNAPAVEVALPSRRVRGTR